MPKMRKIVPVLAKAITGNVLCKSGRLGSKYHVSLDVSDFNEALFEPRCNATCDIDSLFVFFGDAQVEVTDVCKRCLKYTEEVA